MYTTINFKNKKELKLAVASGKAVTVYCPGICPHGGNDSTFTGKAFLEGPHYPAPHTWYATATVKDGVVVSVK